MRQGVRSGAAVAVAPGPAGRGAGHARSDTAACRPTDRAAVRLGYVCHDDPIPSAGTLFNVQGPAATQHTPAVGGSVNLTDAVTTSVGYAVGFGNSVTGPGREAAGYGTRLTTSLQQVAVTMPLKSGGTGGRRNRADCGGPGDPQTGGQGLRTMNR